MAEKIDKVDWLKIVGEVATALLYVHEVGFLHNDLKTNNVVLDKSAEKKKSKSTTQCSSTLEKVFP